MIAKVIAWGSDRAEALARLRRALEEMWVVVRGGATNRAFLLDLLGRPEVVAGTADTGWLDRLGAEGGLLSDRSADVALIAAAIDADDAEEAVERERFYASARRGRPKASHEISRTIELRHRGESYRLAGRPHRPRPLPGHGSTTGSLDVDVERLGRFESRGSSVNGRDAPGHLGGPPAGPPRRGGRRRPPGLARRGRARPRPGARARGVAIDRRGRATR